VREVDTRGVRSARSPGAIVIASPLTAAASGVSIRGEGVIAAELSGDPSVKARSPRIRQPGAVEAFRRTCGFSFLGEVMPLTALMPSSPSVPSFATTEDPPIPGMLSF